MNTGKLVLAIGLAVIAAALLTASVFAFMGAQDTFSPTELTPTEHIQAE